VAGDDAFFAEQHGAAGAGSAGELHEWGEIKLVAAQRALADNEVVEEARPEAMIRPERGSVMSWVSAGPSEGRLEA
jgi:hypothetical protein